MSLSPHADARLERALRELGGHLDVPPAPELAARVRARLEAEPSPRHRRLPAARVRPAWALLMAAALVAVAVLVASPTARRAVAELIGLPGVRIEFGPRPDGAARPGDDLSLGARTSLAGARAAVDFDVLVPRGLGPPAAAHVRSAGGPEGSVVSLGYRARPGLPRAPETDLGLLVMQFRGRAEPELLKKFPSAGVTLRRVVVNGNEGFWIAGDPHVVSFRDADGAIRQMSTRLAANVLLFEQDGTIVRLELAAGRQRALQLARSMD